MMQGLGGMGVDGEAVYSLLLSRPRAGVEDITEELGWSVGRVSAALADLTRLSLVCPSVEEPGKLRLVNPEVGLETLLLSWEEELQAGQAALASSRVRAARMIAEYSAQNTALTSSVQQFMGMDAISTQIELCAHTCVSEVSVFAPRGAQSPKALDMARPLDLAALERGVRVRYVYLESLRNDALTLEYAQWLLDHGGEVRIFPQLPLRMILYDGRTAIVPVDPEVASKGILVHSGTGVAPALSALFDLVWQQADPLGAHQTPDGSGLSPRERVVLELLGAGHTDEVVARKLGISVRTGRRITADLMERLQARSRFQAGVLAMARGWFTPCGALDAAESVEDEGQD
ncbi:LuxR C-terminal-related transcriptional regulator [Streptomyces sp. NPDC005811]|uniref:LuxR C-terminal-related transcriptional regulator n=1 Tax=Streptomyces sp. NPDC005811 TaxID=3154565 RepID=UPI00340F1192